MSEKPQIVADSQRILAALVGMQRAYPIEQRLKSQACDATRETYLAALTRWVQTAAAPLTDGFDQQDIDELTALDALHVVDGRIACPPFSVVPTGIQVHFPHETVHAFSALDALAMPRLLNAAAMVETQCAISQQPIRFSLTQNGEITQQDQDCAIVAFHKVADQINRYVLDLALGIRFVLPQYRQSLRQTLPLGEACAVANAFYSFQRKLLKGGTL